jgi:hydrogenase expression/formation protein HypC
MCLAVPMKVVRIDGDRGQCEVHGVRRTVDVRLVPAVKVNDYVLVHAGFAIEIVDDEWARQTIDIFEDLWSRR